tara:strand:- start:233 stop:784 length:552 start_codon:yes stop_codon:yes gene_type:complete
MSGNGYYGYSKSNNAYDAEEEGKFPLTRASKILAKKLKWSQAKSKDFLQNIGHDEWHHTSCKYNITYYYDVSDERIEALKEEINSFEYKPAPKRAKVKYFKCWNKDRVDDVRQWEWYITNRWGNNTDYITSEGCVVIDELKKLLKKYRSEKPTHKTKLRIKEEKIATCKNIIKTLRKEIKQLK